MTAAAEESELEQLRATLAPMGVGVRPAGEGDAVVIAYIHSQSVTYSWHHSMIEFLGHDMSNAQRVLRGGYISRTAETDGLADARNKVVEDFLREKSADWLFWIDTDMGFAPDTVDRLMVAADPVSRPIVGGLCFTQRQEATDDMGGWRCMATPTLFDWGHADDGGQGFMVRFNYHPDVMQQVAGTGSACILIHRSVFEAIQEKYEPEGQLWYDKVLNKSMGRTVSEDLSFCMRANTVGKAVWVDTSVKTTHQKTLWLAEDDYFGQRIVAQWSPEVPAATEATAVIVPVLGRPQNAAPFMESLKASGADLAKVYAVIDDGENPEVLDAWATAGACVITYDNFDHGETWGRAGTFAEKVNEAYSSTDEPWMFLVGDDVRFQKGWLDHAQHAARDGAHVVGTNDLHNPRVTSGEHATHLLVRRNYVDERGASWDGPKVVCHEGYRHWYVDDEIVTAAKQRGVWAFAKHSKVEHLHPMWGGAPVDATYELGQSFIEQDKALFESRAGEYL